MGIVSSNISGAPFNGGTITNGLEVDTTAHTDALKVVGAAGQANDLFSAYDNSANQLLQLDSAGGLYLAGGNFAVYGSGFTPLLCAVSTTTARFQVPPVIAVNAAPADVALAAGQCALWFDQTNGAAKLMMKAKQADGTVKTGSVNVQT